MHIACLLLAALFLGCASKVIKSEMDVDCKLSISGKMNYHVYWSRQVPVLIRKYDNEPFYGEIVSRQAEGYVFDHNNSQMLFDPKPRLFKWKEIACIIDTNRLVVYGSIPKTYCPVVDMEFTIKGANSKPLVILIEANKEFKFCLDTGYYKIESILFKDSREVRGGLKSDSLPELSFRVENGKDNYLGDIYLDYADGFDVNCGESFRPFVSMNRGLSIGVTYLTPPIVTKHKLKVLDLKASSDSSIIRRSILKVEKR